MEENVNTFKTPHFSILSTLILYTGTARHTLCTSLTWSLYCTTRLAIRPSSWLHLHRDMNANSIVFFVNGSKVRYRVELLDTKFVKMIENILE